MAKYIIVEETITRVNHEIEAPDPKAAMQGYWGGACVEKAADDYCESKFLGMSVIETKDGVEVGVETLVMSAEATKLLYEAVAYEMDMGTATEHGGTTADDADENRRLKIEKEG